MARLYRSTAARNSEIEVGFSSLGSGFTEFRDVRGIRLNLNNPKESVVLIVSPEEALRMIDSLAGGLQMYLAKYPPK